MKPLLASRSSRPRSYPAARQPFDLLIVNAVSWTAPGIRGSAKTWPPEATALSRAALAGSKATRVIDAKAWRRPPGSSTCTRTPSALCAARVARCPCPVGAGRDHHRRQSGWWGPIDIAAQRQRPGSRGGRRERCADDRSRQRAGSVLGNAIREPDAAELDRMKTVVAKAVVSDGALDYRAASSMSQGVTKLEEVIALARVAGGVYTSHVRDEGDYTIGLVASVREVIRVAEEAGVRGVVTHVKALGPDSVGLSKTVVADIEAARARGVEMFADQYPYNASSTSLGAAVLPGPSGPTHRRGWRNRHRPINS